MPDEQQPEQQNNPSNSPTYKLWQLKPALMSFKGKEFLRFINRANPELKRDVDVGFQSEDESAFERARTFIRSLGFKFPLPIKPVNAMKIFSFFDFPAFKLWEKKVEALSKESAPLRYKQEDYISDLNLWTNQSLQVVDYEQLYRCLYMTARQIKSLRSTQDAATYARCALIQFEADRKKLDDFYGTTFNIEETPQGARISPAALIAELKNIERSFDFCSLKRAKKKERVK